jgi:hypothetical protein
MINNLSNDRLDAWERLQASEERLEWDIKPWLECCVTSHEAFLFLVGGESKDKKIDVIDWPVLSLFEHLTFYGLYGDLFQPSSSVNCAERIDEWLTQAGEIRAQATFRCDDRTIVKIIALAQARRRLELAQGGIEPQALAILGGVSEGRIRNLMSGSSAEFNSSDGKIPVAQASAWLQGRSSFWPSIWGQPQQEENSMDMIKVPQASDGTVFHPGLRRRSGYMIGEKGSELTMENYDAALLTLVEMSEPRWRRPNTQGNWGIVKGVTWVLMGRRDLNAIKA